MYSLSPHLPLFQLSTVRRGHPSSLWVRALLARQGFFAAPYRTVHFLSSIYTECIPWWSSCRGLIVLRLRQEYMGGRYPLEIIHPCSFPSGCSCKGCLCWVFQGLRLTSYWMLDVPGPRDKFRSMQLHPQLDVLAEAPSFPTVPQDRHPSQVFSSTGP